jgi:16S rRNA (cytidine1402-2'-O)-methyltransferase
MHEEVAHGTLSELARRFREDVKGEIVVVIGPASESAAAGGDFSFAVDSLRSLVRAGARPRAAAGVVAALTGESANDLYTALTGREPRR